MHIGLWRLIKLSYSKVSAEVMDHLKNAGIELRPYDSIVSEVEG